MKDDHRRDRRNRVFLTARLRCVSVDREVKLTNLSSRGASIDGIGELTIGDQIEISRGDLCVGALVAWAADRRVGVQFIEPIDEQAFRMQGHSSVESMLTPLHRPVERLSRRLERHWTTILSGRGSE